MQFTSSVNERRKRKTIKEPEQEKCKVWGQKRAHNTIRRRRLLCASGDNCSAAANSVEVEEEREKDVRDKEAGEYCYALGN